MAKALSREANNMSDSMPTQTAKCEKHGDFKQNVIPDFMGTKRAIATSKCPKCLEEIQQEETNRKAAQDEYQRQHLIKRCVTLLDRDTPPRFKACKFSTYNPICKEANASFKACKSYAEKFSSIGAQGAGLILCGKLGTGKTHLALAIASEVVKTGVECKYINLLDLIRWVRSSWKDGGLNEHQILNQISNYGLLIIDEIGVQNGTENEKTILFDIINSRYENMLPTIIISNLSVEEISQLISERSVDRITDGGGGTLVFDWGSYRNRGTAA
jgi:DNA replication protein DnaC